MRPEKFRLALSAGVRVVVVVGEAVHVRGVRVARQHNRPQPVLRVGGVAARAFKGSAAPAVDDSKELAVPTHVDRARGEVQLHRLGAFQRVEPEAGVV